MLMLMLMLMSILTCVVLVCHLFSVRQIDDVNRTVDQRFMMQQGTTMLTAFKCCSSSGLTLMPEPTFVVVLRVLVPTTVMHSACASCRLLLRALAGRSNPTYACFRERTLGVCKAPRSKG